LVARRFGDGGLRPEYTRGMNVGKSLATLANAPVRVGLAAADAGLDMAAFAVGVAKRTLGEVGAQTRPDAVAHRLGIDDAIVRANQLAKLLDDEAPLRRALAPDGLVDRLLRPGGVVDMLMAPGGVLDRLTAEGGGLERALKPGGLMDQLLAEDGVVERLLAEDGLLERLLAEEGVVDRMLAEGGLVDKLTARNGPLEQLAYVADTLNRLTPGMEALAPTIEALQDAVTSLTMVVNPLSNIADRIPLPGRRLARRSAPRTVRSQRIVDHDRPGPDVR
jgi:hypothetical protein